MNSTKLFINQFGLMFDDIKDFCPNDKDIKVYHYKFATIKKYGDVKFIIPYFFKYFYEYKDKINGNIQEFEKFINNFDFESKFNDQEVKKDLSQNDLGNDQILSKVLNLKEIWNNNLTQEQKNKLHTHFKQLIKHSTDIINA